MAKIISFEKEKQKQEGEKPSIANPSFSSQKSRSQKNAEKELGTLVWLHCPVCQTFQYSEVLSPFGRKHKCGTTVLEIEVEIDITAEYTICKKNIDHLEKIKKEFLKFTKKNTKKEEFTDEEKQYFLEALESLCFREQKMIEKLAAISQKEHLVSYAWKKENFSLLPISQVLESGIMISKFRFQPEKRFQNKNS